MVSDDNIAKDKAKSGIYGRKNNNPGFKKQMRAFGAFL